MEFKTSKFLKQELMKLNFEIIDSLGYTSFAGILKNGSGPVLLYRTEMDALPLTENTNFPFSSSKNDKLTEPAMHACGHDLHMTIWLSVAEYFARNKNKWKGTLVLLAQSSEENGMGAKAVISSTKFAQIPAAEYQLAFHNTPELPSKTLGFCDGYAMGSVDMLTVTIHGVGGHGAKPEETIDPVLLSAQFITSIQTIVSRNLEINEKAVITVGSIKGGSVGNIIPDSVELKLTVRCNSPETRELVFKRITEIANGLATAAGLDSTKFPVIRKTISTVPPVFNDPDLGKSIRENIIPATIESFPITMIGEDFSYYSYNRDVPSFLIWLGTKETSSDLMQGLHKSDYMPDYKNALCTGRNSMITILTNLFRE